MRRLAQSFTSAMAVTTTTQQVITTGPLPSPEALRSFEEIQLGFAERIVTMAESEAIHRRNMESTIITAQISDRRAHRSEARIGQIFALAASLTLMICGTYIIVHGAQIAGTVFGTTSLAGIASAFVIGRRIKNIDADTGDAESVAPSENAISKS